MKIVQLPRSRSNIQRKSGKNVISFQQFQQSVTKTVVERFLECKTNFKADGLMPKKINNS